LVAILSCAVIMSIRRFRYRIGVLGYTDVGKTSLSARFMLDTVLGDPKDLRLSINRGRRKELIDDDPEIAVIKIRDTPWENEYQMFALEDYVKDRDGFLLVYSITSRESFEMLRQLHEYVSVFRSTKPPPIVLVGNKCDLEQERQVSADEGQELANKWGCPFMEASANESLNVEEAYIGLVRQMRLRRKPLSKTEGMEATAGCCSGCIVS